MEVQIPDPKFGILPWEVQVPAKEDVPPLDVRVPVKVGVLPLEVQIPADVRCSSMGD